MALYEAVISDLIKDLKLNGGSITATFDAEMTLVRAQ
jgi:hypothetical protein